MRFFCSLNQPVVNRKPVLYIASGRLVSEARVAKGNCFANGTSSILKIDTRKVYSLKGKNTHLIINRVFAAFFRIPIRNCAGQSDILDISSRS
jgi:hypothetical protein